MIATNVLITPPSVDVITLAEAKAQCRVDHSTEDDLIGRGINAAVCLLDPAAGGTLALALRPQTWELRLGGFPCGAIELPYPPFIEIVSVKYDDVDGVERTLSLGTGYRLRGFVAGDAPPKSKISIAPPFNTYWPTARCDFASVRVRYRCGYLPAADASGETPAVIDRLPSPIKAWCLLVVETLYSQRGTVVAGTQLAEIPPHILHMISHLKVY